MSIILKLYCNNELKTHNSTKTHFNYFIYMQFIYFYYYYCFLGRYYFFFFFFLLIYDLLIKIYFLISCDVPKFSFQKIICSYYLFLSTFFFFF